MSAMPDPYRQMPQGTPTGYPVDYPVISPYPGAGARLLAYVLDALVVGVVAGILGFTLVRDDVSVWIDRLAVWDPESGVPAPELDTSNFWVLGALTLVVWFVYRILMETSRGQTLGKMALRMKVVDIDGRTPTASASFLRNSWYLISGVLGAVPVLGMFVTVSIYVALGVTISRDSYRRSFADRWGKTYVVSTR